MEVGDEPSLCLRHCWPALKSSGIVWDDETLDAHLQAHGNSFPATP